MSTKFEKLLDFLVNEETDKANELFHEIVVEKSREIYENLIAEEEQEEETTEATDEDEDQMDEEVSDEDDDSMEEGYGFESAEEEEVFPVQDQTDDFADDSEDPEAMDMDSDGFEFGDEEGGDEAATKDDVLDLKDALEELKAEFEALMAGEKHEEEENPDIHGGELDGFGDEESDDTGEEDSEDDEEEKGNPFAESKAPKSQGEKMREYIEKVTATMDGGLVGARTGETVSAPKEGKSPISSGSGKPTSGAKAIPAPSDKHSEDGTSPKGKVSGLVKTGGDFVKAGTKNVASSANSKKPDGTKLTSVSKPGNKEGSPVGSGTGDKAGQTSGVITKSPLSGAPNRAK